MLRHPSMRWSSLLLLAAANVTLSCASEVGPLDEPPEAKAVTPGRGSDEGESLSSEGGNAAASVVTPIQVLRLPVTLARIPGLVDFDFEGSTLLYRKSASPETLYTCTVPDCPTSWALTPLDAGYMRGPHVSVAEGRVYYPYLLATSLAEVRSIRLDGAGDRAEASRSYVGNSQTVSFFGGDRNQVADVSIATIGTREHEVLSVPVGRVASVPKASKLRHTNGDGSIEVEIVPTVPRVTLGPSFVTAVSVPDWDAAEIDEIATSPRTVNGAPVRYPAVGMVEHSGGTQTVRVCPTTTDCTAWLSVGAGAGLTFSATHLYIGSASGLDRCRLSEITRFGTCTRQALARGGPVTDLYLTKTHVVYRSNTQIRAACNRPDCAGNTCTDWMKDGRETDVDCGGHCALPCEPGRSCRVGADCTTRKCDGGVCVAGAAEVSVGSVHACARLLDGRMKCMGDLNVDGQLGVGHTRPVQVLTPLDLGAGRTAAAMAAGIGHTCAVLDDSSVKCWGNNSYGQLGVGDDVNRHAPDAAVNLGVGRTAWAVAAGAGHTCALLDNGTVKCWGLGSSGQLGVGATTDRSAPGPLVRLGAGRTARQIAVGAKHGCAVLDDGTLKCWGLNDVGQLGVRDTADRSVPRLVRVGTGRTVTSVAAGLAHTCAILDDGTVKCWGANTYGQLGVGDLTDRVAPGPSVSLGHAATGLGLGFNHTCASLDDGTVKCWGFNAFGQLGVDGLGSLDAPGPAVGFGVTTSVRSISAGGNGGCAVLEDDGLRCWGSIGRRDPTNAVDLGR